VKRGGGRGHGAGLVRSLCAVALLVSSIAAAGAAPMAIRDESALIPVLEHGRTLAELHARICRPASDEPAQLIVINHGSPPNGELNRPRMQLARCDGEAARWFLARGYVVVFALRRGYGETGGSWAEAYGSCKHPDYVHAGLETARDIDAIVTYATQLSFVRKNGAVVVGQSAGGWGTIAYAAVAHPRVSAFVVMAGGRGGHEDNIPNRNCRADQLVEAARHFGGTARTPMLWIYAANDSFFAPAIARAMWQAFTAAGGQADLQEVAAFGDDGHHLFLGAGGSAVWGPLVESYLKREAAP
jgi:pimeloyl-ACP methyl ester carboxylesterase